MAERALSLSIRARDQASNQLKGVTKEANTLGRTLGNIGKVAAAGLAIGAGALAAFSVKAVMAASDVAESQNKVDVVFGKSAAAINEFAKTSAKDLGMSRGAALEAAGTFGNLFVAMKIGQPQAAEMSKGILKLAADLGSFNNISTTDALDKLRAGLVGETEPLRALGVNLSAAQVKTRALAMGFKEVGGELTAAAKAQASYALIMEQTTTAQGDFANTSTGMANSMKIIQASIANATAEIGNKLLPMIAPLISKFAQELPGAIDTAIAKFDAIGQVIGGLKAIFAGGDFTADFRAGLQTLFGMTIEEDSGIITALFKIRDALLFLKDTVLPGLGAAFGDATQFVKDHTSAQIALAGVSAYLAGPAALGGVSIAITAVTKAAQGFIAFMPVLLGVSGIGLAFAGVAIAIAAFATDFMGVTTTVNQMHELMKLGARKWWTQQVDAFNAVKTEFETFGQTMQTLGNDLGTFFGGLATWMHDNWAVPTGQAFDAVASWFVKLGGDLKETGANMAASFVQIGADIINGLRQGMADAWNGFWSWVNGLWESLPQGLRDWIEGNSPSKVFMEIGRDIVEGLRIGMITSGDKVQQALRQLLDIEDLNADIDAMVRGGNLGGAIERLMFGGASAEQAITQVRQVNQVIRDEIEATAKRVKDEAEKVAAAQDAIFQKVRQDFATFAEGRSAFLLNQGAAVEGYNRQVAEHAARTAISANNPLGLSPSQMHDIVLQNQTARVRSLGVPSGRVAARQAHMTQRADDFALREAINRLNMLLQDGISVGIDGVQKARSGYRMGMGGLS